MCGITGYIGGEESSRIVHEGLQNLEYRGYDSAGIALGGDTLQVHKCEGEVSALSVPESAERHLGIGHTRWSTHGEPTRENAHPHTDCRDEIAVVHNGIIENYEALKEELRAAHVFESETDTEVVPHLLEDELETDVSLRTAVHRVIERLEGSFAIAVTAAGHDEIVVAREDSPLVIGYGEDAHFVASDVTAFAEHTRDVSFLENGDIATVTDESVTVYNNGGVVERPVETVEWDATAAEKGGYAHYMLKEIHEQPQSLRQTLSGRIDDLAHDVTLDIDLPEAYLQSLEEIQIVACGTSYHAGLYVRDLLEEYADIRVSVELASEYDFRGGRDPWRTLVVAITQSGETADTLSALREANRSGARTLALTNTVGSTVTRAADATLYIRAGPEIGVAATKTFVSQVATATLFTVYLARVRNAMSTSTAADLLESLRALPGAVQQILDRSSEIAEIAEAYAESRSFFYIGRANGYAVALESALKLKEISYDHAEGFAAGELKHGPLALVDEDTPVIALLTDHAATEETLNSVREVQSRGAPVIGISSSIETTSLVDDQIDVDDIGPMEPVVANVALQLFAYHVANSKDRAIDKPRNLAKSVTVE